jgi:uroporphyrinogen decarboxylase
MNETAAHKRRLRAALEGERPDRVPYALWGHDFNREWSAANLAEFTVESYRTYDWDLVKLNPRATYYFEAWGSSYQPTGTTQPRLQSHPIDTADQLGNLPIVDPVGGPFAEQLDALRRVLDEVGAEVDVIQTVFNPLTVASGLLAMRPAAFRDLARQYPAKVHTGLAHISRVLATYAKACTDAGASGIFFATVDWATRDAADESFYREYGRPYDLQVLEPVAGAPVNVLHVCRDHNLMDLLLDYPVAAVNWDDHGAGNPSLANVEGQTSTAVMGGVGRDTLATGTADEVSAQVKAAIAETGGKRLIVSAGCSVAPTAPPANLRAFVDAIRGN